MPASVLYTTDQLLRLGELVMAHTGMSPSMLGRQVPDTTSCFIACATARTSSGEPACGRASPSTTIGPTVWHGRRRYRMDALPVQRPAPVEARRLRLLDDADGALEE